MADVSARDHVPQEWCSSYTAGQLAALSVILVEIERKGGCDLSHRQVARMAGVGRTTVQSTVRLAAELGHLKVRARAKEGDSNLVTRGK